MLEIIGVRVRAYQEGRNLMIPVSLPPLPPRAGELAYYIDPAGNALGTVDAFTTDQLREYATAAVLAERERCARVADAMGKDACGPDGKPNCCWSGAYLYVCEDVAAAIRRGETP